MSCYSASCLFYILGYDNWTCPRNLKEFFKLLISPSPSSSSHPNLCYVFAVPSVCDGPGDKAQRCPYLCVSATAAAAAARAYLICMWRVRTSIKAAHTTTKKDTHTCTHTHACTQTARFQNLTVIQQKYHICTLHKSFWSMLNRFLSLSLKGFVAIFTFLNVFQAEILSRHYEKDAQSLQT